MTAARAAPGPARAWVGDQAALGALVETLSGEPRYGLDTEFHRERSYHAHLALLQLSWAGGIALVDPLAVDLVPFRVVLEGPGTCVMHAAVQDLEILRQVCGAVPRRLFDTQVAAGFLGYHGVGLASLVRGELGIDLPKADRLADWMARPLPPGADEYAAADVAHLLELHDRLTAALTDRGRSDWADDECEIVRRRGAEEPDPRRAWWRLKEARNLRGRAAAVIQELAAWREGRGAELDRPVRFVVSDLALVSMAQRPPTDEASLAGVRGLDERWRRGRGAAELLEAVRAGRELPLEEVQPPPGDARLDKAQRATASLVAAWAAQRAAELDLDPAVLATRADVEALLAGRPGRLDRGWRAEAVGGPVAALVAGEAALAVDPEGHLSLERRSRQPWPASAP